MKFKSKFIEITNLERIFLEIYSPKKENKMSEILSSYYKKISETYSKQHWEEYYKQSSTLIRYSRKIPIYFFFPYHEILNKYIEEHGITPYLSWVIEYGFRLLRHRTKESRNLFKDLVSSYQKIKKNYHRFAPVLLRVKSGIYRLVSMNAGLSAATLLLSKFGIRQSLNRNYYPFNYLRVAVLLSQCKNLSKRPKEEVSKQALENCLALGELIKSKLDEQGGEQLDGNITDMEVNGIKLGLDDCLSSLVDDTISEFTESIEKYNECREHQRQKRDKRNWIAEGDSDSTDPLGNINTDVFSGFPFADGFGGSKSHTENDDGTFTVESFDSEGNLTNTSKYNKYGAEITSTSTHTDAQGTATFEHHADGSTTVTTTTTNEETGSTITVTTHIDENGNQVGESDITIETQTGDPIDEYYTDPCAEHLHEDLIKAAKEFGETGRLDPWIVPNPNAPTGVEDDPCLTLYDSSTPTKCLSIALCLDGYEPDEDCQCGGKRGSSLSDIPSIAGSSTCARINCGDRTCDPTTGTCRSGGDGSSIYTPGRVNPLPLPIGPQLIQSRIDMHKLIDKKLGNLQRDIGRLRIPRR